MSENKLFWSDRALDDRDILIHYLWTQWGEDIMLRVIHELDAALIRIEDNPELFPVKSKRKAIRRCVFSPQTSVYFKIIGKTIEIVSIFDNRQNPKKLKGL